MDPTSPTALDSPLGELSLTDPDAGGVTVGSDGQSLVVTCSDRDGLLSDLVAHLRSSGVDLVSATVATDTESGLIVDTFVVRDAAGGIVSAEALEKISASLWQVALGGALSRGAG